MHPRAIAEPARFGKRRDAVAPRRFPAAATAAISVAVIIACPECGARYRLPATTIAENARMRCAACDHRWVVEAAIPDEIAFSPPPEPVVAPAAAPVSAPSMPLQADDEPQDLPRSSLMRTLVAVAIGGALTLAAAALWLKRVDPAELPLIGDQMARLSPPAIPLGISFTARTTALPSGDRLLEINGRVINKGAVRIDLPPLEARLAGPGGTVRRWRIAIPAGSLDPGKSAGFASTATDFPADATIVGIRPGR